MDPTANLREQLEIARRMTNSIDCPGDGDRLAELVAALDDWLTHGGFLPDQWAAKPTPSVSRIGEPCVALGGCSQCKRGTPSWPGRVCDACHELEISRGSREPQPESPGPGRFTLIELE